MALRNIYQSAPIIWVAEWNPIVQGRPKNTIYQDYLMMRLIHDAQIENKVPLKILGIELVFACRGWLLHLNCGTNSSCILLAWKSPNCVHIITKMAVKPVYTYHAEKKIYPMVHYIEYLIPTLPTRQWYYFFTILKHIMPSQIWSKHCTSNDLKKSTAISTVYQKWKRINVVVVFADALITQS